MVEMCISINPDLPWSTATTIESTIAHYIIFIFAQRQLNDPTRISKANNFSVLLSEKQIKTNRGNRDSKSPFDHQLADEESPPKSTKYQINETWSCEQSKFLMRVQNLK